MLAHEIIGTGSPLLLIHGLTESRRMWDPLVPALAADHTVVLVDLPGHGESGPAASYAADRMADEVASVVREVGVDDPIVVGHSLGGVVATAYGGLHPSRGIVNVDQPLALADFQGALRQIEPALRGDVATFTATMDAVLGSMEGQLSSAEHERMNGLRRSDQAVVLAIWSPVLESSPADLDALIRSLGAQVKVPYFSLHGIDPGPGYGEWLAEVIPGATIEVWPEVGHYPHLVHPERFLARLAEFEADQA
jgi:pimeloyl-ACP methyl ester carboxylesterase